MRRLLGTLYIQVLIGIALGLAVGALWPEAGAALKPLGDAFIKLIKMVIAPVIFCTVALGIAQMGDMKKFGRIGGKAILYFEVVSTFALLIGLIVGEIVRPGAGFNIDPAALDESVTKSYVTRAAADNVTDHLMNIIPDTFFGAFTGGLDLSHQAFRGLFRAGLHAWILGNRTVHRFPIRQGGFRP